ncbi:hypothetical protein DXG03_000583 [Asterophora parasitica]|uniref:Uncharacterized protein n=1 Tax=Asterophora parasitica TaxID=117018 RepID=A0A9P7K9N3_9AGAR|nr:hypothetical protein DXG03_000583 [Asterophora parasitica]
MLCITTTDVVVELCLNIALFVNKNLNADQQFGGISQWWNLTAFGCFLAQVALGDSILVRHLSQCPSRVVVVALAQNVLTSSLIVFRLWAVQKESARYKMDRQNDRIGRAIRVTIDAGLPYTASLFVLLGFHIKAGQAQDVVMHAGVSFNLVICRIVRNDPDEEILSSIMTLPSRPMVIKKEVVVSQTRPNDEWSSHSRWSMGSEVDGDHKARSLHPSEISDSQDEFR